MLIWAGSQNHVQTRADVAQMLGIPLDDIRVLYTEQASQFGRGGVDDAAPAAALLSKELGRPVRVQWMREDEHAWAPQQPGRTHDFKGDGRRERQDHRLAGGELDIRARWDQGWPLPWHPARDRQARGRGLERRERARRLVRDPEPAQRRPHASTR